jgi:hypothetical protein
MLCDGSNNPVMTITMCYFIGISYPNPRVIKGDTQRPFLAVERVFVVTISKKRNE